MLFKFIKKIKKIIIKNKSKKKQNNFINITELYSKI